MNRDVVTIIVCLIATAGLWQLFSTHGRSIELEPYEKMVAKANRPRVIVFGARWCPACRAMQNDWMLARQQYAGRVDFIELDWNTDRKGPHNLFHCYDATKFPTIVFLNRKGKEFTRHTGWPIQEGLPALIEADLRQ